MEIPHYATEKIWDCITAGVLPLYWGPEELHRAVPPRCIIDCRQYFKDNQFDVQQLLFRAPITMNRILDEN